MQQTYDRALAMYGKEAGCYVPPKMLEEDLKEDLRFVFGYTRLHYRGPLIGGPQVGRFPTSRTEKYLCIRRIGERGGAFPPSLSLLLLHTILLNRVVS